MRISPRYPCTLVVVAPIDISVMVVLLTPVLEPDFVFPSRYACKVPEERRPARIWTPVSVAPVADAVLDEVCRELQAAVLVVNKPCTRVEYVKPHSTLFVTVGAVVLWTAKKVHSLALVKIEHTPAGRMRFRTASALKVRTFFPLIVSVP